MKTTRWQRVGGAAALSALALGLLAAVLAPRLAHAAAAEPAPAATLPPAHEVGAVRYVSGGVGADEAARFKAEFGRYPLVVEVFRHVGTRDEYTAGADLKILDRHGRALLDEHTDGPFTLVSLPLGDYRVSASLADGPRSEQRTVHVTPGGHAKAVFVFGEHAG